MHPSAFGGRALPNPLRSTALPDPVAELNGRRNERGEGKRRGGKNDGKERQESPAVADKPARRLRKVRTVYVRAVGL